MAVRHLKRYVSWVYHACFWINNDFSSFTKLNPLKNINIIGTIMLPIDYLLCRSIEHLYDRHFVIKDISQLGIL